MDTIRTVVALGSLLYVAATLLTLLVLVGVCAAGLVAGFARLSAAAAARWTAPPSGLFLERVEYEAAPHSPPAAGGGGGRRDPNRARHPDGSRTGGPDHPKRRMGRDPSFRR